MDDEGHRVGLVAVEIRRLDHVALHFLIVPALEGEEFHVAHCHPGQAVGIEVRDLMQVIALVEHVDIGGMLQVVARQRDAVETDVVAADRAIGDQRVDTTVLGVDREQRMLSLVIGGGVERLAVLGNAQATGRAVPVLVDLVPLATGQIQRPDRKTVGLGTRHLLRQVVKRPAIRRRHWPAVPGLVVGREVLRLNRAIHRHLVDVEVGRPGLAGAGDADIEVHGLTIGRKGVFGSIAERLGRNVAVDALAQQHRSGARPRQPRHEQLRAATV